MSKTASEWVAEGLEHSKNGKNQEAIQCFDEAIAVDPTYGEAYFQKGFINDKPELLEEELDLYKKAISVGYDTAQCYYCLGVGYKDLGRFEEGLAANLTAIEKNPDYWQAYDNKGQALMAMGRSEESIEAYRNVIRLNQNKAVIYCHLGSLLETIGETNEAMEQYTIAASKGSSFGYFLKGELELSRGKYEEAITTLLKAKEMNFSTGLVCAGLATAYKGVGRNDEATKMYEEASNFTPRNAHEYCSRGQSFFALGNKAAAMNDFHKADELLKTDKKTVFSPHYVKFIKDTLKAIFDAEEVAAKAEAEVAKLNVGNAATNRFVKALKKLQEEKDKVNSKLISQIGKSNANANQEAADNVSELNKLKEEFQRQLNEIKAEVGQVQTEVKAIDNKVQKLEKNMEEMKEELNNKLDDFEKKLDSELNKQDLSPEDQQKLKGYYSAFIQTFSCVYVTSQVVDSGQVSLDTRGSATTILSTIASFAPFIGNMLASGVASIEEFFKSQELIKNARRMKGLAHDPSKLSQIIGQSAFEILQDKNQQQKVINTTDEDLQVASGNLYQKILEFCENSPEKIDTFLYTEMYSTPAERLGHNDANQLISLFIKGTITPFGTQKQFVKEVLNPSRELPAGELVELEKLETSEPRNCCSMF